MQRVVVHGVHLLSGLLGDDIVGRKARVGLLRLTGARLAPGASIHGGVYVSRPSHLSVGRGSFINRSCYLDLEGQLELGANVTIGHGTTFITTRHKLGPHEKRCGSYVGASIVVEDGAWLGANVTVLGGVRIGSGAVVAAGAVVSADVPPDTLVSGVPAKVQRSLDIPDQQQSA